MLLTGLLSRAFGFLAAFRAKKGVALGWDRPSHFSIISQETAPQIGPQATPMEAILQLTFSLPGGLLVAIEFIAKMNY